MNKNLYFYQFTFVSRSCVRTSLSSRHKVISRWRGPNPHYHLSLYIGQKTEIRAVHHWLFTKLIIRVKSAQILHFPAPSGRLGSSR